MLSLFIFSDIHLKVKSSNEIVSSAAVTSKRWNNNEFWCALRFFGWRCLDFLDSQSEYGHPSKYLMLRSGCFFLISSLYSNCRRTGTTLTYFPLTLTFTLTLTLTNHTANSPQHFWCQLCPCNILYQYSCTLLRRWKMEASYGQINMKS